jgi:hypothetical protein
MLLPYCNNPVIDDEVIKEIKNLPENVQEKVIIKKDHIIDITHKEGKKEYVPKEGKTEVIIKKDGSVVVKTKKRGLCFSPGIGGGIIGSGPRFTIDTKFVYFGRFGLVAGVPIHRTDWARPYMAMSYTVYNNTSLTFGSTIRKDLMVGIRVSF